MQMPEHHGQNAAVTAVVQTAIQKQQEMKNLSMVTERPDRYADFQVADSGATIVTIGQGGKNTSFLLGKPGPTLQTSYARQVASKEVWEIAGNHSGTFNRKAKEWRDMKITTVDMNAIQSVVLEYPSQSVRLSLADSVWKVDTGKEQFEASKDLAERLTRMISKFSAVDFADTLAPEAFDKPEAHIIATLNTGETIDLKLIPKDEAKSQYYVRKQGASSDFVIYKSTADALMKKPEDFKQKDDQTSKEAKAKTHA
jgi:hypothetical protein